ncbi:MAG: ribosome-associated translation inhibitor RaiA [Candidatus Pacebacteria bacterium]|jgi:ribosomal subunit interface protein|nr:ribosome-associated translation inhibitor RaiA [Candidatus Paceibacterota bacterium]
MNINIKTTSIELTADLKAYVEKRVESLSKIIDISHPTAVIRVEVGKTTEHHRSGDIYRAEFHVRVEGVEYYASSERDELYTAIDETRDELLRQARKKKGRMHDLFERGARSLKKRLKGIKPW